jgi:phage terminase small subunit
MAKSKLTDKQEKFCREYVKDFNGAQAAIRSGYSKKTAKESAAQVLTNINVTERINELTKKQSEKSEVTAQMIIDEFKKIAFTSIAHLHNTWITRKEFEDLTDDQKAAIQEIKTRTRTEVINKTAYEIEEIQIKLYDKQRALENLGKHIGFYAEDNAQRKTGINHDELTTEELLLRARALNDIRDKTRNE